MLYVFLLQITLIYSYEVLPGFSNYHVDPRMNVNGEKMKFAFGTVRNAYEKPDFLSIPSGREGERLRVPKAFYHYSEQDLGADANFGLPDDSQLLASKSFLKNNRKEINGIYLPLPNMDPINLHFITQKTFEKGLDTSAHDDTPDGALARAKKICLTVDELTCEKALLHYHRIKSEERKRELPLHEQLLSLGDLTSSTKVRDRESTGMGVVLGVPGYDPMYVGAALDNNNDGDFKVRFSPSV